VVVEKEELIRYAQTLRTDNTIVRKGQANGTQYILKRILLQHGELPSTITIASKRIQLLRASQVNHLQCMTKGKNPKLHKVEPVTRTFTAKYPLPIQLCLSTNSRAKHRALYMMATQLPVVSNNATTGFKLQGASVPSLLVKEWRNKKIGCTSCCHVFAKSTDCF